MSRRTQPYWPDICGHPTGSYLGSVEGYTTVRGTVSNVEMYDVYVFDPPGRQRVCLRHGEHGSEYIAFPDLQTFIRATSTRPEFDKALGLMLEQGYFQYTRNVLVTICEPGDS